MTLTDLSTVQNSSFNAFLFRQLKNNNSRILWLIYLGLVMLAVEWLAAEFLVALNARFTSASTALANFQTLKIQ